MSQRFSHTTLLNHSPERVFAWHERPGAFARLTPPWVPAKLEHFEGIGDGDRARIRLGPGPLSLTWEALHSEYEPGVSFTDEQVSGPFKSWVHRHLFEPAEGGGCRLTDSIEFEMPAGGLGGLGAGCVVESLQSQFTYRHSVTANDLELHARYADRPLKIAVSGSSGLIGSTLTSFLTTGGHTVVRLVRRRPVGDGEVYWNVSAGEIDAEGLEGIDAVVHLAGESLMAPRWTEDKKRRIYDSRVLGTRLIADALGGLRQPPRVFVSSSAIGIYGDRGSEEIDEGSSVDSESFLARVCADWEAACEPARTADIRTVNIRTGLVVSGGGGALAPMLPLFKLGLGGRFGDPSTYLSWIAMDDMLGAIYHAIWTEDLRGPVNLTAPNPLDWDRFATAIGSVMNRPTFVTVPTWITRAATGEMGRDVILSGARVEPKALLESGYEFLYPEAEGALRHQLGYPIPQQSN